MNSLNNELASWAALISAVVSFLGLIQSRTWLAGIGAVFIAISITTFTYARKEHRRVQSANVRLYGRSLDSLNVANLRRRVSGGLQVQEASQTARIDGTDLTVVWQYKGYCHGTQEATIEFSIDSARYGSNRRGENVPQADFWTGTQKETSEYSVRTKPLTRQTLRVLVGRGFLFDRAFASTVRKE